MLGAALPFYLGWTVWSRQHPPLRLMSDAEQFEWQQRIPSALAAQQHSEPITVCGDGQQVRGNTYIADCVRATVAAVEANPGELYNVGGGEAATVWDILHRLERLSGRRALTRLEPARAGDQLYTFADTTKLRSHLGWEPRVTLDEGLAQQWVWQKRELEQLRLARSA